MEDYTFIVILLLSFVQEWSFEKLPGIIKWMKSRWESSPKAFPQWSSQLLVSNQSNEELELGRNLPLHFTW